MVKATFSLDETTMAEHRRTAARLKKPQSHVVRDAVTEHAARANQLTDRERLRLLDILDRIGRERPSRAAAAVDAELRSLRAARRRA